MKISSSVKNNNIEINIRAGGRYLNDHVRQYRLGLTFGLLNHFIKIIFSIKAFQSTCSVQFRGRAYILTHGKLYNYGI